MKIKAAKILSSLLVGSLTLSACNLLAPKAETAQIAIENSPATESPIQITPRNPPGELPSDRMGKIGDNDASLHRKVAPDGDRFSRGDFERPFSSLTMDVYFPYLDIQNALIYQDETWIFGEIALKEPDKDNGLPGNYAIQFDTNKDGKGDWLVIVSKPASKDWSINGVQVWQDANGDVGGEQPVRADDHPSSGDGFEVNVFDSGQGNDASLAWARISPENDAIVQIAIKRSLIDSNGYLVNMWAGTDSLNPALFDLNDHMTHEQAGAADPGLENFYPIKQLSELDNTCSMAVGFQPVGSEPGLCTEFVPKEPGSPPVVPGQPPPPPPPPPPIFL